MTDFDAQLARLWQAFDRANQATRETAEAAGNLAKALDAANVEMNALHKGGGAVTNTSKLTLHSLYILL